MDPIALKNTFITCFDSFELRMLEARDLDAIKRLDPGDLSCCQGEWLFPRGREEEFIEKWLQERLDGKGFGAGIFRDDVLIGIVALRSSSPSEKKAGLSYAMDGSYRGKGIMTKACQRLIYFGFTVLGLDLIEITADVANKPSWALAERLGFKKEALVPEAYQSVTGKQDAFRYVLMREEAS